MPEGYRNKLAELANLLFTTLFALATLACAAVLVGAFGGLVAAVAVQVYRTVMA